MNKLYLFLFAFFLISSVSALDLLPHRQGDSYDLKIACLDNASNFCTSTTGCALTIDDPNGINLIKNQSMTFNNQYYNYTLNSTQTNLIGTYTVGVLCFGATSLYTPGAYQITPTGTIISTGQSVLYFIMLLIALAFFGITLYGALKIPYKNVKTSQGFKIEYKKYSKILCWYLTYLSFLWVMWSCYNLSYAFFYIAPLTSTFKAFSDILTVSFYPINIVLVFIIISTYINDFKLKKLTQRGLEPR